MAGLLAGCGEKARLLQVTATQFGQASDDAITSLDALPQREIAAPAISDSDAATAFASRLLSTKRPITERTITERTITVALDPYTPDSAAVQQSLTKWHAFTDDLRKQYVQAVAIYDQAQNASVLGTSTVTASEPYIAKLTAQMAYLARTISANPPRFVQTRSALLAAFEGVRTGSLSDEDKSKEYVSLRQSWLDNLKAEQDLATDISGRCLQSATLGMKLHDQVVNYATFTVEDVGEALSEAYSIAGMLSGKDLTKLNAKTQTVIAKIESDPAWSAVAQEALKGVNAAFGNNAATGTAATGTAANGSGAAAAIPTAMK